MDERVRRHAEILVDHCTDIAAEDDVLIRAPTPAEDLVVALHERIGEVGACPSLSWLNSRAGRAYARAMDADDFRLNEPRLAAMEETDVVIMVTGATNAFETSDVDPGKSAAASRANGPILEERLDTRWVITQHPTPADAQQAEMSTEAWEAFVYDAVNRDWDAQRAFQERMVEILDPAEEVRIVSGDATDVTLSVDGMAAANDYAKENLPGGEVYTSPVPDGVDGEVTFDLPVVRNGREVEGATLRFEDGEVVDHGAEKNGDVLTSVLETDEGARRVGELGIGMNRGIDEFSYNMLFDEKMGDTVHLALGKAIEECVPEGREFNDSAVHVDMLVDMSEDSRIEVDGEVVQRNGTFAFEGSETE
ncbi:aminopeptidase [Halostella litorea]|uniref:aminopeptidase n=1 Tax=Halostella litorea TaxID=2528831 RepID=UPI00109243CE|nr:aminopeptidase [Halostella litorea]